MSDSTSPGTRHSGLEGASLQRTRVWDLPTRLFHWALAAAVVAMVITGSAGIMEWHFRIGYTVLALLLFRIAWGFVGGRWSRFAAFVYAPRSVLAYLRGHPNPDHLVGHNPLGALSVFGLLAMLTLQVSTGLVADDEIAAAGPLTRFVSGATVSAASGWHIGFGKWIVMALVALHVLAVLFYVTVRRQALVKPMVGGDKFTLPAVAPSRDDAASRLLALAIFAVCAGFAIWVGSLRA